MLGHILRIAVVAAFCAAWGSLAEAQAPPVAAPAQEMLLLRNGEVISGKITKQDDVYLVDLAHGRIRVKQADVGLICSSLEDGYQKKRAVIQVGNVHDHLELAQWCLRHNLLGSASLELADATAADPKNPMIAALKHRLKMAMEPPPVVNPKKGAVTLAGPSNDELDRMLRGMPRAAVETFTQSVQPVLLNHCATAGCHGPQAESFRLHRVSAGVPTSRRTTQRNLYSALKFINTANPSASRLLSAASQPHGTVPHAIFTERDAVQYQHLVDWVNQMAGRPMQELPRTAASSGPAEVTEPMFGDSPPGTLPRDSRKAQAMAAAERRKNARRPTPSQNAGDAAPASFDQPADPHDPEVFNRLYGREKGKPDGAAKQP
jgi:hypothetical protein